MKNSIWMLIICLIVSINSFAGKGLKELIADYYVTSSERDASLSKNEAKFIVKFNRDYYPFQQVPASLVKLSCNGVILSTFKC